MSWLAADAFRSATGHWGGELVDTDTPYAARDKVQHGVLGFAGWLLLWGLGLGWLVRLAVFLVLCVTWEVVELVRLLAWRRRGSPPPYPRFADFFSWRDIVAGLVGAAIAELPLLLRGMR